MLNETNMRRGWRTARVCSLKITQFAIFSFSSRLGREWHIRRHRAQVHVLLVMGRREQYGTRMPMNQEGATS
eukprot:scaffold87210_cov35-Tisochrysis_lutea.AAC.1